MNTVFMVIGAITCLAISAALLAYAYGVVLEKMAEKETARFYVAKEKAAKEIGQSLRNASWWFSESDESMKVLDLVGESLVQYGVFSEDKVRDRWRAEVTPVLEKSSNDEIKAFVAEKCAVAPDAAIKFTDLYAAYRGFCDQIEVGAATQKCFAVHIKVILPDVKRTLSSGQSFYSGITLTV